MKTSWLLALVLTVMSTTASAAGPNPMHPTFPPLDSDGRPVRESGAPVSYERTCGGCHDTAFISSHSSHDAAQTGADCATCHVDGGKLTVGPESLDDAGNLRREALAIGDPKTASCARCHGVAREDTLPMALPDDLDGALAHWGPNMPYGLTLRTGEIIAPQKMSESQMNLAGKDELTAPFDVHAARLVSCTSCHFAPNNPAKVTAGRSDLPFLARDPRRLPISEFIRRPDHELSATSCTGCHEPMAAHDALPYKDRHLERLACTSCHAPKLPGPALRTVDSTVVTAAGAPRVEYRNMDATAQGNPNARYIRPYQPFLFVDAVDGKLAPYNLITEWRWVSGPSKTPVALATVASAFLEQGAYAKEVVAAFDSDHDGSISAEELKLDSDAKVQLIKSRLEARGVQDAAVEGVVTKHEIHHGVMANEWVARDCDSCHKERSRLNADVPLSSYQVAGVMPVVDLPGLVERDGEGGLLLRRPRDNSGFYVMGHDRVPWTDSLGFVIFLGTAAGITAHGIMRYRSRAKRVAHTPTRKEYVYSVYERIWHWLMAASILLLLWTGIEIHWAGSVSTLGFTRSVLIHNVLAVILIANAFLSLFYHLASNDIRQFIPPKENFVAEVVAQAKYYLNGIFVGAPHPIAKSVERKLNPLQQVTYLVLLNILIPLQVITGVLIWGTPRWAALSGALGGLTIITPAHSLGAWLLATFVVAHVYLTTTGHTPLSNIRAMIEGEDEIEIGEPAHEGGKP